MDPRVRVVDDAADQEAERGQRDLLAQGWPTELDVEQQVGGDPATQPDHIGQQIEPHDA